MTQRTEGQCTIAYSPIHIHIRIRISIPMHCIFICSKVKHTEDVVVAQHDRVVDDSLASPGALLARWEYFHCDRLRQVHPTPHLAVASLSCAPSRSNTPDMSGRRHARVGETKEYTNKPVLTNLFLSDRRESSSRASSSSWDEARKRMWRVRGQDLMIYINKTWNLLSE